MTLYYNDDIISSMQSLKYPIVGRDNLAFIYSGLGSISDKERKHLKNIAESLIAIQNHPGTPVPDSVCREIIQDSKNTFLKEVK